MSNVTVYQGSEVVVHDPSEGVVTPALSGSVTLTNQDREVLANVGDVFAAYGLDRGRAMEAAEQFHREFMTEQAGADDKDRKQVRTQMQQEWGASYAANVKRIRSFIESLPVSVQDVLWDGRTLENTLALNDPSVLRWLLRLSQPAGAYRGNEEQEKREIEALMRKPGSRYWKGPDAERLQARYRELVS